MNEAAAVELLHGLVAIPSLSREEAAASAWLVEQMTRPATTAPMSTPSATRSARWGRRTPPAWSCSSATSTPCRGTSLCASRKATPARCSTAAAASTPRGRWRRLPRLSPGWAAPGRTRTTCVLSSSARWRRRPPAARAPASFATASTACTSRSRMPASSASQAPGTASPWATRDACWWKWKPASPWPTPPAPMRRGHRGRGLLELAQRLRRGLQPGSRQSLRPAPAQPAQPAHLHRRRHARPRHRQQRHPPPLDFAIDRFAAATLDWAAARTGSSPISNLPISHSPNLTRSPSPAPSPPSLSASAPTNRPGAANAAIRFAAAFWAALRADCAGRKTGLCGQDRHQRHERRRAGLALPDPRLRSWRQQPGPHAPRARGAGRILARRAVLEAALRVWVSG
jgi:hypothetical protein